MGRAGKGGGGKGCWEVDEPGGEKRLKLAAPRARADAQGHRQGGIKSVLDTRLQHLARYVDATGALIPYQTGITQTRRDTCHLIHDGSTSRACHRSLAAPGFGVALNSCKICQAKPPASGGPLPILATQVVRIRFDGTLQKIRTNVFGRLGVTSSRPAWTAFFLVVCDIAVSRSAALRAQQPRARR